MEHMGHVEQQALEGVIRVEAEGGGNTNPPLSTAQAREEQSRYWLFTSYETLDTMKELLDSVEYIIGKEVCPTTGRLHLQGFIRADKRIRPLERFGKGKTHWTRMKLKKGWSVRTAIDNNINYCSKEGDVVTKGFETELEDNERYDDYKLIDELQKLNKITLRQVSEHIFKLMFKTKKLKMITTRSAQKDYVLKIYYQISECDNFDWFPKKEMTMEETLKAIGL